MRVQLLVLSFAALAATSAAARAAEIPPPSVASPPVVAPRSIWRVPVAASKLRLTGELSNLGWPIYVPAAAVPAIKVFQLAFQAAIEVMPEASAITVRINGQILGQVPIASPTGVKTVLLDVPPGVLATGWNAVELEVSQRHRVDCSLASTYELWTQIDPTRTGFVGAVPPVSALSDLPSVPTDETGTTRLHLLLANNTSPADLGRAVHLVEQVALSGHYAHPVVDTTAAATGLNLAIGLSPKAVTQPAAKAQPIQVGSASDGGVWLSVASNSDGDVDRAVEALAGPGTALVGTEDGLQALSRRTGLRLRPGGALTLAELGIMSRTFSGRVFREAFEVLLPPDAYPADYAEARLSLNGGYAAGLTRDARLLVRVNGVIDGNLDFDRAGGEVLHGQVIHMPLDPFRPGRNKIEIEAQLPALADQTCDTLKSIGAKERFLLLGTSTLSLPPLARVAQFPSISATLAGNLRVTPGTPPQLFLPRVTEDVVAAVGTLLSNAAVSAGVSTGAVFQRDLPQPGPGPTIAVGASSDMPAPLVSAVGMDPQALSVAWRSEMRPEPGLGSDNARGATAASDLARLDAWGERIDNQGGWLGGTGSVLGSVRERFVQSLRGAGLVPYPDRAIAVTGDTSFVFAQGLNGETPLTVITARDGAALASGAAALTDPARLASLAGRAVTLDASDAGADLVPTREVTYFRTQPFSITNDRLIAAGWLSKHAAWYIGASLLGAAFLGMTTWAFLTFGRRGPLA